MMVRFSPLLCASVLVYVYQATVELDGGVGVGMPRTQRTCFVSE